VSLKTISNGYLTGTRWISITLLGVYFCVSGCVGPRLSTQFAIDQFNKAGPVKPRTDFDQLVAAQVPADPYVVVRGDVLTLHMPAILYAVEAVPLNTLEVIQTHLCRIDEAGKITLPIVGQIQVEGKNLSQIESAIVAAYYPKYVKDRPSVVVDVSRYHTEAVSVVGAVKAPGIYPLRSDEKSLVALLMKSGGIEDDGARAIKISNSLTTEKKEPIVLPVKGMNIPFADIALQRGDVVEVERLDPEVFTVVGLVNRPGPFSYPPEVEYNLWQAIAFAGGLNDVADPQYVKIYRQKEDGQIIDATFKLNDQRIASAAGIKIKPGDVVSVEQTSRTRSRLLFAEIFRVTFGVNVGGVYRYLQGKDVTERENVTIQSDK